MTGVQTCALPISFYRVATSRRPHLSAPYLIRAYPVYYVSNTQTKGVETESFLTRDRETDISSFFFFFSLCLLGVLVVNFPLRSCLDLARRTGPPHRAHARTFVHTDFVFAPQTGRLVPQPAGFPLSTRFNCALATPHCCPGVLLSARFIDDNDATLHPPVAS